MHETFWTLVRDRGHWEFEIFLMVVFDVVLAGIWQFFVRRRKAEALRLQTPEGVCDGCGGTVKHLIESGIKWCFGCGEIRTIPNSHTYHYTADETPVPLPANWALNELAARAGHTAYLVGQNTKDSATVFLCDGCGKPIEKGQYASFGGNWVPYIPAKCYHMACIPTIPVLGNRE